MQKNKLAVGLLKNLLFLAMFLTWIIGGMYWLDLPKTNRFEPIAIAILYTTVVMFMLQHTRGLPFTYHKLVCEAYE